jgi:thioredoxin 1
MDKVLQFTDDNFEAEVLKSNTPVLVDFWAEWCGPCHMIAPTVKELAAEFDGKVKVGKLNVDDNQNVAMQFGIRSIPTLLIFKDGQEAARLIGVRPKHELADQLKYFAGASVEA